VSAKAEGSIIIECNLFDEADSSPYDSDSSTWKGSLALIASPLYESYITLPLNSPLNTTQSSTVEVACQFYGANGALKEPTANADAQLQAVQTTGNS
jgi:hypothetical protein